MRRILVMGTAAGLGWLVTLVLTVTAVVLADHHRATAVAAVALPAAAFGLLAMATTIALIVALHDWAWEVDKAALTRTDDTL